MLRGPDTKGDDPPKSAEPEACTLKDSDFATKHRATLDIPVRVTTIAIRSLIRAKAGRSRVSNTEWTAKEDQRALQAEVRERLEISHRRAKEIILRGGVTVDGHPVTDPGFRITMGNQLTAQIDAPRRRTAQRQKVIEGMEILHQDRHILVVTKPAGLLTVASEDGENEITLQTEIYRKLRKEGGKNPPLFIVQRLDLETSGVLVIARTIESRDNIKRQLLNNKFRRRYLAICQGKPASDSGTCDLPLHTDTRHRKVRVARPNDPCKSAVTHWKILERWKNYCLMEVHLETGRRNQIRVHLAHQGYPVVGDDKYGVRSPWIQRTALHAESLALQHPLSGEEMNFQIAAPDDFEKCKKALIEVSQK